MHFRLQILIAVILVLLLLYIVQKIKSRKLEIKYALTWFAAIALLLLFDLCPFFMEWLADVSGVATPSNWLFAIGFAFFVFIVLSITLVISKLVMENNTLIQEVGILKRRVEILENRLNETGDSTADDDTDK